MEECSDLEMVFGRRTGPPSKDERHMKAEVAKLESWKLDPQKAERRRLKSALGGRRRPSEPRLDVVAESYADRMTAYKRKNRGKSANATWKGGPVTLKA